METEFIRNAISFLILVGIALLFVYLPWYQAVLALVIGNLVIFVVALGILPTPNFFRDTYYSPVIEGVLLRDGKPVAGAEIRLNLYDESVDPKLTVITGADGSYRFEAIKTNPAFRPGRTDTSGSYHLLSYLRVMEEGQELAFASFEKEKFDKGTYRGFPEHINEFRVITDLAKGIDSRTSIEAIR